MRTKENTLRKRKTAITVPAKVLAAVDRAAQERGQSRSHFISVVLAEAVRARRDAEITRRLNELFSDDSLVEEERRSAKQMEAAGVDWTEDDW
jgi:hypothetical protein